MCTLKLFIQGDPKTAFSSHHTYATILDEKKRISPNVQGIKESRDYVAVFT